MKSTNENGSGSVAKTVKIWVGTIIAIIALLILNPFSVVGSNERGLKFRLGALQDVVLQPGLQVRVPIIETISTVSLRPIEVDYNMEVGKDGAITKDNQTVGAKIVLFYKYEPSGLVKMWRDVGEDKVESLVVSALKQGVKTAIGNYTIFDIPTNQDALKNNAKSEIADALKNYQFISVEELRITNYDWSDEFDKQIALTMEKAQQVKQKEQELTIANLDAQKSVKQAEADKESTVLAAEAQRDKAKLDAEAKVLEGQGIQKYNQEIAVNWDIELQKMKLNIELTKAQKWNGAYVPNNMYGPIPLNTKGGVQGQD
jgi:regulator of protease activity HflC (stomatin/prohibitin superfamily)